MYFHKVIIALRSVYAACRSKGVRVGLLELKNKLWHRSCSLLYVRCGGADVVMPESIRIRTIIADERQMALSDILAAGAGTDIRFFDSGAICYLAYQNDQPVGLGWMFRDSYLLQKILASAASSPLEGEDRGEGFFTPVPASNSSVQMSVYLAGFHVIESARGQGIYPLLLNVMCRDAMACGATCYVDVASGNQASIRGIEKAGFLRVGELRTAVIAGIIIRCKIAP